MHPKRIDLSLGRVHNLLKKLSSPEEKLAPVVHIAGTNGKGSVVAHLKAMIEAAGYTVHTYTSPHLVKFNERICLAGQIISDEDLIELLEECENINLNEPITFFEITTVAAILGFSRVPADIVILETGLGGRLDATNVIAKPLLNVITSISMDHEHFLGDTIEKIAFEKAGILKPNVVCIVGPQFPSALDTIEKQARRLSAPLIRYGFEWSVENKNLPDSALPGEHQRENATIAAVAADHLKGFVIGDEHVRAGLSRVTWPARFQKLTSGVLTDLLPVGWELWLDGGHNEAAGKAICRHATSVWEDKPLYLIVGMINSKNSIDFLRSIKAGTEGLWVIPIPNEENSYQSYELASAAQRSGFSSIKEADNAENALTQIVLASTKPARILICGSLYLAGTVLSYNN